MQQQAEQDDPLSLKNVDITALLFARGFAVEDYAGEIFRCGLESTNSVRMSLWTGS